MKPKFEIVPRPAETVDTAPGDRSAKAQRDRYRGALESELGMAPRARRERLPRVRSAIDFGTIVSTFFLALVAFATIFAAILWRDGRLPRLWPEQKVERKSAAPKTDWILSGEKTPVQKAKSTVVPAPARPQEEPAPDVSVTDLSKPASPPAEDEPTEDAQ